MQEFDTNFFEAFLSQPYISNTDKDRLKEGLAQFNPKFKPDGTETRKASEQNYEVHGTKLPSKNYTHFYLNSPPDYLLQGDILPEIRIPIWNSQTRSYEKRVTPAMLISSTCDIEDESKQRKIPKDILFAPIVILKDYLDSFEITQNEQNDIENQRKTNIFYLPIIKSNEYVVMFDKIFSFPAQDIDSLKEQLVKSRIASLDYFGYYLFLMKLSYHLCRLPEDKHR